MRNAFTILYQGLDRQGPGEPGDVAWAADAAGLKPDALICDAGCGTGADIPALLAAAPAGKVTAIDKNQAFIDRVLVTHGSDARVMAFAGNMAKLKGPFDLIWSAGSMYFLGVEKALKAWRPALSKSGAIAFSEPCVFDVAETDESHAAIRAFWGDYEALTGTDGLDAKIRDAGFETIARRRVSESGWQAYYGPLAARIAALRPGADEAMNAVLDASEAEIQTFQKVKDKTGYALSVVRPV